MMERKVRCNAFEKRLNTTLFAMAGPVDAWFLCRGIRSTDPGRCHGSNGCYFDERHFYELLIEQLIDNRFNASQATTRAKAKRRTDAEILLHEQEACLDSIPSHLQLVSVAPTKRFKAKNPKHGLQGRCLVCDKPATTVCRVFQRDDPHGTHQFWICDKPGKACMGKHIMANHPDMVIKTEDKAPINWNRAI